MPASAVRHGVVTRPASWLPTPRNIYDVVTSAKKNALNTKIVGPTYTDTRPDACPGLIGDAASLVSGGHALNPV